MSEKVKVDLISVNTKKTEQSTDSLKKRIKELRLELEQLDVTSAEFAEKSNELGNLMHQNSEITRISRQAMNDFGSTMTNITQVAGGVTGAVQGVVAGLSLMGVEVAKDDIGMIKLMTALQGLAQSFTLIDTGIKGMKGLLTALDANLMKVLAKTAATVADTAATEANTAATVQNTAATAANATAQGEQAAAQAASAAGAAKGAKTFGTLGSVFTNLIKVVGKFKAALGVAALAITAVTFVINQAVKAYKTHREEIEKNAKEIERLKNATAETDISFQNLQASYASLTSDEEKKKWIEAHASEMTKLGIAVDNVNEADKVFIEQSKDYQKALEDKAKAEEEVNHAQQQQLENINKINKITAQLHAEGFINSDGSINYTKKIKVDDEKNSVENWLKMIAKMREENDKLQASFVTGTNNIANATAQLRKIDGGTVTKTSGGGTAKDWVAELKKALSDADSLYTSAVDKAYDLRQKLDELFGKTGQQTRLDKFLDESALVNDKLIGDLVDQQGNIVSIFGKWWQQLRDMQYKYSEETDAWIPNMKYEETTEGAYVTMFNKIGQKLRSEGANIIASSLEEGFDKLYPRMEKMLEEFYGSTEKVFGSITGPSALFNKDVIDGINSDLTNARDNIAAILTDIEKINAKPKMSADDKKRLTQLQKALTEWEDYYNIVSKEATVITEIAEKYKELNNEQRQMFVSLENLKNQSKRIGEVTRIEERYFERLTQGIHQFGAEYNKSIAEYVRQQEYNALEINQSQELIRQYERELNAYDTTTERKIELMSLLMQEQQNLEKTQREGNLATYEFNTKLFQQYYDKYDEMAKKLASGEGTAQGQLHTLIDTIFGKQEDWNTAANAARYEMEATQQKIEQLAQWREQNVISEGEYQQRLAELTKERTEREIEYEKAAAERKTQIWQTSYQAYESIQQQVGGLLSAIQQRYDENSEQYKQIQRYNIIADTISGAMAAFSSGIKSGIPWPGNMILAGINAGLVTATGIEQLNNLKNNRIGSISSSASKAASSDRYETLANANDQAELMGSIKDSKVYVVESEIQGVGQNVRVYENESRW